jgi:hypothetical protein
MLPQVSQLLHCLCLPVLRRVMWLYHFPNPAGAVESFKQVIVSLVLQLLPLEVPLCDCRQPGDLHFGGIRNAAQEMIDFEPEIRLASAGHFPGGNL